MGRMGIDGAYALVPKGVGARRGGGAAGTVVTPNRRSGLRNEAETIASDAGHMGLDDRKRGRRRDRGIRRCAARLEGVDRHLARQRMRGCRHAVAGEHRRAAWAMEIARHSIVDVLEYANTRWSCAPLHTLPRSRGRVWGERPRHAQAAAPAPPASWRRTSRRATAARTLIPKLAATSTKLMTSNRKKVLDTTALTVMNSISMPTNRTIESTLSRMVRRPVRRADFSMSIRSMTTEPATIASLGVIPHSPPEIM